jgi:uncharacterized phiE125 gp8 family phage protein
MSYKGEIVESVVPVLEPVTLAEVQKHLRLEGGDEDELINQLIVTARRKAETYCARSFINTTWIWYLAWFEDEMIVPIGSLSSVTNIKYLDTDGNEQTLATAVYQVDSIDRVGRVLLDDAQSWPSVHAVKANPIYITYVAGYGAPVATVPDAIKDAILRIIGTLYEAREDCSIDNPNMLVSRSLLDDYKLRFNV